MKTITFVGIYKVPEAARYLWLTSRFPDARCRPTPHHLFLWMRQALASVHLVNISGRQALIDFEDLISMRVICFLHGMGIPIRKIRDAKAYLEKLTGHSHPFATETLWTETVDIFSEIGPLLVTASKLGQLPFLDLVKQDLVNVHDMTFRQGVADSWKPRPGILLKPNIQFGAPCIAGTGIPTHSLWRMFLGGDSIKFLAQSYEIDDNQIEHAIEWEEDLAQVTFARTIQTPTLPSR